MLKSLIVRILKRALKPALDRLSARVEDVDVNHRPPRQEPTAPVVESSPEPQPPPALTRGSWARPLGLKISEDEETGQWRCTRRGHDVMLPRLEDESFEHWEAKRRAWSQLLAARLCLDALELDYTSEMERAKTPERIIRKEDVPLEHGERLGMLVHRDVLEDFAQLHGSPLWHTSSPDPSLCIIYVQEFGTSWHAMTQAEVDAHPLGAKKIAHDAYRTLFYQSYRVRPQATHVNVHGKIKHIETTEGYGASRIQLLPDFDHDALLAQGFCAAPSRHIMLVAHPQHADVREASLDDLRDRVHEILREDLWPLSSTCFELKNEGIEPCTKRPASYTSPDD